MPPSAVVRVGLAVGFGVAGLTACGVDEPPTAPAVTVTATVDAPPAATTATPRPTQPTAEATVKKPAQVHTPPVGGGIATFEHFKVTVRQVRRESDVRVLAEVCVRSLPPDPQGNRTRISWDPWSVWTGSKNVDAGRSATPLKGGFPAERLYRVGQCASGWIPFPTTATPARINYNNGVGDVAVWDADHPEDDPRISQAQDHQGGVYFNNCDDVRAAGRAPIRRGDPGYGPHLDGDDDGIACET